jgi:hypothetical protein
VWCTLVHVCQRWWTLVFGSPRYLNVQLLCTERIQVKKMLDIWPALPIVIQYFGPPGSSVDNMFAALEHSDRLHSITLCGLDPGSELEKVVAMMQDSFPVLTDLRLDVDPDDKIDETALVIPDSFLGGSAPCREASPWAAYHFRDYRSYFCLPLTYFLFNFGVFLMLRISHQRRWSPASLP